MTCRAPAPTSPVASLAELDAPAVLAALRAAPGPSSPPALAVASRLAIHRVNRALRALAAEGAALVVEGTAGRPGALWQEAPRLFPVPSIYALERGPGERLVCEREEQCLDNFLAATKWREVEGHCPTHRLCHQPPDTSRRLYHLSVSRGAGAVEPSGGGWGSE